MEGKMKYSVGDTVVYGTQGVCSVKEISPLAFGGASKDYYVLCPIGDCRSKIYVPCDNESLTSQMRPLLTPDEIREIISASEKKKTEWIASDSERKEYCASIIKNGDRTELMSMVAMLYLRQEDLKNQKKHFHVSDERFLREGVRLLHEEFAFSLGISIAEVPSYIESVLEGAL